MTGKGHAIAGRLIIFVTALAGAAAIAGAGAARATGICDCCSDTYAASCKNACEKAVEQAGFCRPAIDFQSDAGQRADVNPLNGPSLKYLVINTKPGRRDMELLRRFLERNRQIAEAAFRKDLLAYKRKKLSAEDFLKSQARRDQAMVNYYHAMQAYLSTPSPR